MANERHSEHGKIWRLLAHRDDVDVEFENQGTFDELVVDEWLHVEQMEKNVWWLRVGDARLIVTLDADGQPNVDVERGFYAAVRGATHVRA